MRILLNERPVDVPDGTTFHQIRDRHKPDADLIIINGFPAGGDQALASDDAVVLIRRGEIPGRDEMEALLCARHTPGVHEKLKRSTVGIAGLGGLGSSIAIALTRVGIGKLILADYDVVEPSNLNRQQYFVDQIGEPKTRAITEILSKVNPFVEIEAHHLRLDEKLIPKIFARADVIVEAFDRAEAKVMMIETVLVRMPETFIVSASGVAGYGDNNAVKTRQSGKLFICGDETTEAGPGMGLMAPRVGIAAHHQANQVMEILLGTEGTGRSSGPS